jgi:oxygen-independent coproporphyrinogen-3 oxidase
MDYVSEDGYNMLTGKRYRWFQVQAGFMYSEAHHPFIEHCLTTLYENGQRAFVKSDGSYNIFTMDETETVLACGAGGVSKLKDPYSEELSRIFNFKYSYEYISRYGEILERKGGVKEKYEQFRERLHQVHQSSGADQ